MDADGLDLDFSNGDAIAIEAVQRLLRLAAAYVGGDSHSDVAASEVIAITRDLLGEIRGGDAKPLAWFVFLAGYVSASFSHVLADPRENPRGEEPRLDASEAIRVLEIVLERELRADRPQPR